MLVFLCVIMCIFTIVLNVAYFDLINRTITDAILTAVKDTDFIDAIKHDIKDIKE